MKFIEAMREDGARLLINIEKNIKMRTELIIIQAQLWILMYLLTTNNIMQVVCITGVVFSMVDLLFPFKKRNK